MKRKNWLYAVLSVILLGFLLRIFMEVELVQLLAARSTLQATKWRPPALTRFDPRAADLSKEKNLSTSQDKKLGAVENKYMLLKTTFSPTSSSSSSSSNISAKNNIITRTNSPSASFSLLLNMTNATRSPTKVYFYQAPMFSDRLYRKFITKRRRSGLPHKGLFFYGVAPGTTATRALYSYFCRRGFKVVHYRKFCNFDDDEMVQNQTDLVFYRTTVANNSICLQVLKSYFPRGHYEIMQAYSEFLTCNQIHAPRCRISTEPRRELNCSFARLYQNFVSAFAKIINEQVVEVVLDSPYPFLIWNLLAEEEETASSSSSSTRPFFRINSSSNQNSTSAVKFIFTDRNSVDWAYRRVHSHPFDQYCKNGGVDWSLNLTTMVQQSERRRVKRSSPLSPFFCNENLELALRKRRGKNKQQQYDEIFPSDISEIDNDNYDLDWPKKLRSIHLMGGSVKDLALRFDNFRSELQMKIEKEKGYQYMKINFFQQGVNFTEMLDAFIMS